MMFYRVWGCCWCGLSSLLRATTTWAPENDDFSSLRFFFFPFHFPSVQEKHTPCERESKVMCTAIKWRSSSRAAFKRGLPTVIRLFFSFFLLQQKKIVWYFLKRASGKKTHTNGERERVGKSLAVVNFVLSTRSRAADLWEQISIMHIHLFALSFVSSWVGTWKPEACTTETTFIFYISMTLLSEPTFFHFDFTFIYKQFTRSGCFTLGRLKATGFIGARVRTTKLPILRAFFFSRFVVGFNDRERNQQFFGYFYYWNYFIWMPKKT